MGKSLPDRNEDARLEAVLFYGFAIILVTLAETLKFRKQAFRSNRPKEAHGKATGKRLSERSYGEGALGKKPSERSYLFFREE
jgi:hypothetical protein